LPFVVDGVAGMAERFSRGTKFNSEFSEFLIRIENVFFCGVGNRRPVFHFSLILVDGESVA
jgi:hypothetical protein